ncbi:MAG TPA: alkaline phosphatase family protein [Gemmatimonadales bacterium]|nr:alkaline phosphatase family protein [Gemmatimonadales bacterium]
MFLSRFLPLAGLLFCATPSSSPVPSAQAEAPAPQATKPTLLVFITVDQMRADYLDKWKSQFSSGLKRLVDGGALFTNGYQDHAITETAPGHASTMSGRFPRSTGIARNLEGVNDSTPLVANAAGLGASPARFRGTTLTDWLTSADPKTRALSVSFKDRGAILMIGRSKQDVYWYSPSGIFTTSKWYRDSLPAWVTAYNATYGKRYAGRVWTLLLPESAYPEPDSVPIEGNGRLFQFPYPLSASPDTVTRQLPNTPFLDEATAGLALVGLEALGLGKGPQTDVLAVSFSATDLIGHRWGPDSRELHDQVLRLDRTIGAFIDSLYHLRDSTRIIFALTADHGVTPFPELSQSRYNPPPVRVALRPAITAARAVLAAAKVDTLAVQLESGSLMIDRVAGMTPALINASADSFVAVARRIPGVARAERFSELTKHDLGKDAIARRWLNMYGPDVPAEAIVVLTPGSYRVEFGIAMHGSPSDDDSHVPILFYGAPFKPGRYPAFVRTVDIAPTLAQVLGVVPAEPLDGRALTAAIK